MEIELKKNEAAYLAIGMVDSATPASFKTGLTVTDTAYSKIGAGAWTSLSITDTFAEIASTGVYEIDLTAGELNYDQVLIKLTATGAADTLILIRLRAVDVDDLVRATTPANTLAVDGSGYVTVVTNNDKTGYTASTVTDKTGYSLAADQSAVTIGTVNALAAAAIDAIWDELTTGHVTAGSFAKLLIDNIDVVLSTRSSHSAADVWAVGTRTITGGTIDTNNDKTGYALSAAAIDAIWDELTAGHAVGGSYGKLLTDYLDAAISSRSSHAAADIWSVGARTITGGTIDTNNDKTGYTASTVTDKTGYSLAADQSAVTIGTVNALAAAAIDAIWDELTSGHVTVGSFAKLFTDQLDAAVSSRSSHSAADVWSVVTRTITGGVIDTNNDKTGYGIAVGGIASTAFAANALDAAALATDFGQEIADRILARNLAGGSDGGRDIRSALRLHRNKSEILAGTLTVYEENDVTVAWTAAVTTTAGNPITAVDPT